MNSRAVSICIFFTRIFVMCFSLFQVNCIKAAKYHLLVITLLGYLASTAQVPGFQGKKFSISYGAGINHPALVGRSGMLPMLYHNASIDYVVARAWTVGVKYGFMTYSAPPDRRAFYTDYNNYTNTSGFDLSDYRGRYTQHTASFIAKKFITRKGYIAPVGRYIILGCYYQYVVDNFSVRTTKFNPVTYNETYTIEGRRAVAHYGGLTVGIGRNFIVARRMIIDISATLSGSPVVLMRGSSDQQAVYRNMLLRNLFQVTLAFGALAF